MAAIATSTTKTMEVSTTLVSFAGLMSGMLVCWIATYVHELAHWLFIGPFGGSVSQWHAMPPGWASVVLAPEPWGTVSLYAGGFAAGAFLAAMLASVG
ncbi:hypothetical protein LCGC14_1952180 [marine sediment metagenome]|uniref:Peptidase M50 domain-containing protein n=1 Tax=marine sediment metagenome TaxID=412755 RepID=A0A0F9G5F9_9ZZZZ